MHQLHQMATVKHQQEQDTHIIQVAVLVMEPAVQKLMVVAEQYPDLKANENFLNLQNELVETENYLQFARRYYNGAVRDNNNLVESFPANLLAGLFGFRTAEFFEIELASQRQAPDVNL